MDIIRILLRKANLLLDELIKHPVYGQFIQKHYKKVFTCCILLFSNIHITRKEPVRKPGRIILWPHFQLNNSEVMVCFPHCPDLYLRER